MSLCSVRDTYLDLSICDRDSIIFKLEGPGKLGPCCSGSHSGSRCPSSPVGQEKLSCWLLREQCSGTSSTPSRTLGAKEVKPLEVTMETGRLPWCFIGSFKGISYPSYLKFQGTQSSLPSSAFSSSRAQEKVELKH